MDPAACREQLGRLISEETRALNELGVLLNREHGYLVANDVAALEGTTRERQQCIARIFLLDEERRALCESLGRSSDQKALEDLFRWCDPEGALVAAWADCSAAATKCRNLNDRNGVLVGARLKHVQERLETLIDGRRDTVTYGPRGAYSTSPAASGRVVATEA